MESLHVAPLFASQMYPYSGSLSPVMTSLHPSPCNSASPILPSLLGSTEHGPFGVVLSNTHLHSCSLPALTSHVPFSPPERLSSFFFSSGSSSESLLMRTIAWPLCLLCIVSNTSIHTSCFYYLICPQFNTSSPLSKLQTVPLLYLSTSPC